MPQRTLDAEIDRLYQLPLDEFTAARNTLSKQAGSASADIRGLQKPPVAAWAVNQVYWHDRPAYDALIEAATDARAAHRAVLSGKKADLRTAGREHDAAIEAALKSALAQLQNAGHPVTDATRQAIATTLRGLPADEPPGRLGRVLQPGGFEMLAGVPVSGRPARADRPKDKPPPPARAAAPAKPAKQTAAQARAVERAKEALASATRGVRAAEHTVKREEFEVARAARDAEKAARALTNAREALDAARRAVDEAEQDVTAATHAHESAERRARDAEATLEAARVKADDAQQALSRLTS